MRCWVTGPLHGISVHWHQPASGRRSPGPSRPTGSWTHRRRQSGRPGEGTRSASRFSEAPPALLASAPPWGPPPRGLCCPWNHPPHRACNASTCLCACLLPGSGPRRVPHLRNLSPPQKPSGPCEQHFLRDSPVPSHSSHGYFSPPDTEQACLREKTWVRLTGPWGASGRWGGY